MENNTLNAVILTCSSLEPFVKAAQREKGTDYPTIVIDRIWHVEPADMKRVIKKEIEQLPEEFDTILVAMGFCGGVWDHVTYDRRIVIPRVDDCVSLLLTCSDEYMPNRKEIGHLYLYENDPEQFSALSLLRDYTAVDDDFKSMDRETLFNMWFANYHYMDIIDTGFNDCYSEAYVLSAQKNADRINAALDYVPGSNRMLEKLVSGDWDAQFLIAEPGRMLRHADFFE